MKTVLFKVKCHQNLITPTKLCQSVISSFSILHRHTQDQEKAILRYHWVSINTQNA